MALWVPGLPMVSELKNGFDGAPLDTNKWYVRPYEEFGGYDSNGNPLTVPAYPYSFVNGQIRLNDVYEYEYTPWWDPSAGPTMERSWHTGHLESVDAYNIDKASVKLTIPDNQMNPYTGYYDNAYAFFEMKSADPWGSPPSSWGFTLDKYHGSFEDYTTVNANWQAGGNSDYTSFDLGENKYFQCRSELSQIEGDWYIDMICEVSPDGDAWTEVLRSGPQYDYSIDLGYRPFFYIWNGYLFVDDFNTKGTASKLWVKQVDGTWKNVSPQIKMRNGTWANNREVWAKYPDGTWKIVVGGISTPTTPVDPPPPYVPLRSLKGTVRDQGILALKASVFISETGGAVGNTGFTGTYDFPDLPEVNGQNLHVIRESGAGGHYLEPVSVTGHQTKNVNIPGRGRGAATIVLPEAMTWDWLDAPFIHLEGVSGFAPFTSSETHVYNDKWSDRVANFTYLDPAYEVKAVGSWNGQYQEIVLANVADNREYNMNFSVGPATIYYGSSTTKPVTASLLQSLSSVSDLHPYRSYTMSGTGYKYIAYPANRGWAYELQDGNGDQMSFADNTDDPAFVTWRRDMAFATVSIGGVPYRVYRTKGSFGSMTVKLSREPK